MNLKLETEFSKAEILQEVDALKKQIDDMRPLQKDVEGRVMQKLRLDWNYHSNAIEGNRLTYGETIAFLMEGITAKGKPIKDHLDIRGHNEAINFLLSIIKDTRPISEADIRALHKMILVEPYDVKAQTPDGLPTTKRITLGEYKTSPNHVKTSTVEIHYYATPEDTPAKMRELMEWYVEASNEMALHPVVIAALFHHKFVSVHPFDDGNGRLSRILMNLVLMQKGYPPVVIRMEDRQNYYSLLSRADNRENGPFIEYITERLMISLQLYLKAANGGDIDEDEDLDKEIALFRMELLSATDLKDRSSSLIIEKILKSEIEPLIDILDRKAQLFRDLFFEYSKNIEFETNFRVRYSHNSIFAFFTEDTVYINDVLNGTHSLSLTFTLKNFRSSKNDFSASNRIDVSFDDYYYRFSDINHEIFLSKFYHEKLSKSDLREITKVFVDGLQKNISDESKSSES